MTNIKRLLFLLLLLSVMLSAATAEEVNPFESFEDALGGYYGEIGGIGLSYQHWFGSFGIQTALGLMYYTDDMIDYSFSPNYTTEPYEADIFVYNIGVEVQYMLYQDSFRDWFNGNLYVFAGGKHDGAVRTTYTYEEEIIGTAPNTYKEYPRTGQSDFYYVPLMSAGFGFGFEPVFFKHLSIPIEFGLMGQWEFGTAMPVNAGLTFQSGLRYRF